ncbi:conserved hypothetical protein [Chryseobacterium sp. 8AT]|nr:conserved hypothetical protein [Chryseobacterium sp. 8AT]
MSWYKFCEFYRVENHFKTNTNMKYSKLNLAKEAIAHKGFLKKIPDMFRMVNMWRKGNYPVKSMDLILPLVGLLYVISPIDIIPDFIIVAGVLDDLAVLSLAIPKLIREVDKFLLWEAEQKYSTNGAKIIDAEIV